MKTRRYVAVERIPRTFLGKLRFLLFGTTITELKEVVENPEYEEAQFEEISLKGDDVLDLMDPRWKELTKR